MNERQEKPELEYGKEVVEKEQLKLHCFICKIARGIGTVLFFCVLLSVFWLLIINAKIPSESMEPTLNVGDRLFGWKQAYVGDKVPERYDIVIFKRNYDDKYMIKRVIGLPGDMIEFKDGSVYVNDKKTRDDFCKEVGVTEQGGLPVTKLVVPVGCYFVLGDNRLESADSRYWTNLKGQSTPFITEDEIVAKAVFRYYPFNQIGMLK